MVKNVSGGNKSKGFARKNFTKKDNALRSSEDEDELYAQVTKIFGGTMCEVISIDGTNMLCHIRGKFRGRGKRDNFIGNGTWLLVGKREWEKEASKGKLLNCDVIEVYNDSDKIKLKNNITTVDWSLFITNDTKIIGSTSSEYKETDLGIVFTDEKTQEYQELIETQVAAAQARRSVIITTDDGDIVDVDDI
jgi:initiation factor 1A